MIQNTKESQREYQVLPIIPSKPLDKDQIREILGLLPRAEYLAKRKAMVDAGEIPWNRAQGTTTEMILDALVQCQSPGRIYIKAYCRDYARELISQVKKWAVQIGLDAEKLDIIHVGWGDDRLGCISKDAKVFIDHFTGR